MDPQPFYCVLWIVLCTILGQVMSVEVDEKGYILYCPCMGRFGNQADHFLGALSFAKSMDRTLVLPPWVEYRPNQMKSTQVPFDTYFKVSALSEYHRVMTMETFMKELAPTIWPQGKRTAFCFQARTHSKTPSRLVPNDCNAHVGQPYAPFWASFNVSFSQSELHGAHNLYYNPHNRTMVQAWAYRFPPSTHPVMAFTGAPAAFPVREADATLHRYLQWSDHINYQADKIINEQIVQRPYLAIHMRNGIDWTRACEHTGSGNLFASAQCLGYRQEHGDLTQEICLPPDHIVIKQVKATAKLIKAKALFVATDDRPLIKELSKALKHMKVKIVHIPKSEPHVDLAVLAKADHYIGNCVSTFSAFAARERTANDKSSSFWAFPTSKWVKKTQKTVDHEEL